MNKRLRGAAGTNIRTKPTQHSNNVHWSFLAASGVQLLTPFISDRPQPHAWLQLALAQRPFKGTSGWTYSYQARPGTRRVAIHRKSVGNDAPLVQVDWHVKDEAMLVLPSWLTYWTSLLTPVTSKAATAFRQCGFPSLTKSFICSSLTTPLPPGLNFT